VDLQFSEAQDAKFKKHFNQAMDDITLVLKCHLLLEEMLRSFCHEMVAQPKFLAESRLTFAQIVDLSQALYPTDVKLGWLSELWVMASKINRLRNMLAHSLEPDPAKLAIQRDAITNMVRSRMKSAHSLDFLGCLCMMLGGMNFVLQAGITGQKGEDPLKIPRKPLN
jgi:hypothetical protein